MTGEGDEYVGRLAPSPSGLLHVGHAQTFTVAARRAQERRGRLLLRIEDLDAPRCKPEFLPQMIDDLRWLGLTWSNDESLPEYSQSKRTELYRRAWKALFDAGAIYPSPHSRKDVERCVSAPHAGDAGGEPIFPPELRPPHMQHAAAAAAAAAGGGDGTRLPTPPELIGLSEPTRVNWRFRVPDGRAVSFTDALCGHTSFTAGTDFGDFIVWSGALHTASYELAVVVDDLAMGVTEVVRGQDLLLSTARQILLAEILAPVLGRDLQARPLGYCHCPLVLDEAGVRLAKRTEGTTLAGLRRAGCSLAQLRDRFFDASLGL